MNKENFSVSVVIPNFNGEKLLEKNLPYVLEAKKNGENKITEVVVVDDASRDASVSLLRDKFPEVKVIKHKVNRGFASSVNTGVRSSKGTLIALLNTDVHPEPDFLIGVLPHFEDDDVFGVSLHERGFGYAKGLFKDGFIVHSPGEEVETPHSTFWISGGSGVFNRNLWNLVGGMDEKLLSPFYWEDLDLSYRALKRGFNLLWEPNARVIHEHESTIGLLPKKERELIQERNQLLFIWKNLTSPNLFRKHLGGLIKRIITHPGYFRVFLMALLKLRDVLRARGKEKKEARVSDETIFSRFK